MQDNVLQREYENSLDLSSVMTEVYWWMSMGLALTAIVALALANSPSLVIYMVTSGLFYAFIIGELVLVFFFSARVMKMSVTAAKICFFAYSALNGITISLIFLIYTKGSIATTLFITAGMFIAMSSWGYKTKKDMTSWGSYLYMALIGLILAIVINLIMRNDFTMMIISLVGVVLFTLLTAYDTQKIKNILYNANNMDDEHAQTRIEKIAIFGALILYLDFINLFLYLLRLLGRRD